MANTQINIIANGTKTLTTAGKYCDRNIDVNVNVPGKATQFTNLYDPANVVLKTRSDCSSSEGITASTDKYVNYIEIPYHHVANTPVAIRVRGISVPVRDRQTVIAVKADGTPLCWDQFSTAINLSYDEYGDMVCTFNGSKYTSHEWYSLRLNFQYVGVNSGATEALTGPIITINEPIGNGGYAE